MLVDCESLRPLSIKKKPDPIHARAMINNTNRRITHAIVEGGNKVEMATSKNAGERKKLPILVSVDE